MRVQSGHWLDYDPIALVVLVIGIGAVALLALSIWSPPGAIRATTFWHRQARLAMPEEWCGHPATCFERRSRGAI